MKTSTYFWQSYPGNKAKLQEVIDYNNQVNNNKAMVNNCIIRVAYSIFFIGTIGCVSNNGSQKKDTSSTNSAPVATGTDSVGKNNLHPIMADTSPVLSSFKFRFIDWTTEDFKRSKHTRATPFEVVDQQMNDSILTIILLGTQNGGRYEGSVKMQGQDITLYYWYSKAVAAYMKIELTYQIRIPDRKDYRITITSLGTGR